MTQPPRFPSYADRPQDDPHTSPLPAQSPPATPTSWVPPTSPHDSAGRGTPTARHDSSGWVPPAAPLSAPHSFGAGSPQSAFQVAPDSPESRYSAAPSAYQVMAGTHPAHYPAYGYGQPAGPQGPQGTNGLAVGALVTGLMGLGPVPIGLGVGALVTLRRSGEGGKGMAIAGIVLGAVSLLFFGGLALLGVLSADDDPYAAPDVPAASADPAQGAADPVDIGDLTEGACYDDGEEDFEAIEQPCTSAHDGEVFSTLVLPPRDFPGDRAVQDEAQDSCDREFAKYVGIDVHSSRLETDVLYPDRTMWEDGYRDVMCLAYGPDGDQLTGTVKGSRR